MAPYNFVLKPLPPFRLDLTAWVLRRRAGNEMDRWDGNMYYKTLLVSDMGTDVAVRQSGTSETPKLTVRVNADKGHSASDVRKAVSPVLEKLLGLNVDLSTFYEFAAGDKRLAPLANRFRGFKPPRFTTPFEALVNAIACQQVTLTLGVLLLNRLVKRFGIGTGVARAFPRPQDLARKRATSLRALGFSQNKTRAILSLAQKISAGGLDLDRLEREDDVSVTKNLCALYGIGRWSAEYVMLRGFGRTHVFPGDDVGARNNLVHWLACSQSLDYDGVQRVLSPWRPYGGLIYLHLLLESLVEKGQLLESWTG